MASSLSSTSTRTGRPAVNSQTLREDYQKITLARQTMEELIRTHKEIMNTDTSTLDEPPRLADVIIQLAKVSEELTGLLLLFESRLEALENQELERLRQSVKSSATSGTSQQQPPEHVRVPNDLEKLEAETGISGLREYSTPRVSVSFMAPIDK